MFARASLKTPKCQQGLVFLVLIIFLVLASIAYMFSGLSVTQIKADNEKITQINLKKAKQALIEYAVTYADRNVANSYGVLPNPETSLNGNDGNMAGTVGAKNINVLEWLPWRSLDLPTLKDAAGNCLFYAISGTYKLGARADMINEDSIGMFRVRNSINTIVQGTNIEDRIVAIIFAPGAQLPGQVRTPTAINSSCGRDYGNVSAYLEGNGVYDNSALSALPDTIDDFIHSTDSSSTEATPYNDKFLTITRDEIWRAIVDRSDFKQDMEALTQALAMCVAEYANLSDNNGRRIPWPTKTNLGATLNYRLDASYVDDSAADGYSGRYPFDVGNSNNAIDPVNLTEDRLFEIAGLCNNFGIDWEGVVIDLETDASKYRQLWNNWKDHFFYIISKSYEPDNTGTEKSCADVGASCITVNVTEYAGAVIFSGSRMAGVTRNDKSIIADYLEDGKDTEFANELINKTGDRTYVYTDPQTATNNDVMYCIRDQPTGTPLDVIECL